MLLTLFTKREHKYLTEKHGNLTVPTKNAVLKANAEKTEYMCTHRKHTAGQNYNIQITNTSFNRVDNFKCFRKILTNKSACMKKLRDYLSGNAGT